MKSTDERVTDLEIRYTEQEDLLAKLDEIVREQQDELERLAIQLRQATQRMRDLTRASEDAEERTLQDDKPPHY